MLFLNTYQLGKLYLFGKDKLKRDITLAYEYLAQSAFRKNIKANTLLGWCNLTGLGIVQNLDIAILYCEEALMQDPLYVPAVIHKLDALKLKNMKQAIAFMDSFFRKYNGEPIWLNAKLLYQLLEIAQCYQYGNLVPKNNKFALEYIEFILNKNSIMQPAFLSITDLKNLGQECFQRQHSSIAILYYERALFQIEDENEIQNLCKKVTIILDRWSFDSHGFALHLSTQAVKLGRIGIAKIFCEYLLKKLPKSISYARFLIACELALGNIIVARDKLCILLATAKATLNLSTSYEEMFAENLYADLKRMFPKIPDTKITRILYEYVSELANSMFAKGYYELAYALYNKSLDVDKGLQAQYFYDCAPITLWSYVQCLGELKMYKKIIEILQIIALNDTLRKNLEIQIVEKSTDSNWAKKVSQTLGLDKKYNKDLPKPILVMTTSMHAQNTKSMSDVISISPKTIKPKKKQSWAQRFKCCSDDPATFDKLLLAFKESGITLTENMIQAINKYREDHVQNKYLLEQSIKRHGFESAFKLSNTVSDSEHSESASIVTTKYFRKTYAKDDLEKPAVPPSLYRKRSNTMWVVPTSLNREKYVTKASFFTNQKDSRKDEEVKGNIKKAITLCREASERRDPAALYQMGLIYEQGIGLKKEETEGEKKNRLIVAFQYFYTAALYEFTLAQTRLAFYFLNGTAGIKVNLEEGIQWMTRAAFAGELEAQQWLEQYYQSQNVQGIMNSLK
jgi:TPR repeat protein